MNLADDELARARQAASFCVHRSPKNVGRFHFAPVISQAVPERLLQTLPLKTLVLPGTWTRQLVPSPSRMSVGPDIRA